MLDELDKAKKKWGGRHTLIDRWLDDRQQLLINYCGMLNLDEINQYQTLPDHKQLTNFCEQLVDYISLGHFEVYESLAADSQNQGETSLQLARELYPEITKTTDMALAFNDKYTSMKNSDQYSILSQDLSQIGEVLANRIELEDQLIDTFHKNH